MKIADITLTLFFTKHIGLKQWSDIGIIDRERAVYKKLSTHLKKVNMITYGDQQDNIYSDKLKNIKLLPVT
jgi:hypothetical protein